MKKIFIILCLLFPFFGKGQKIEFRLGGSISYNAPYLNDVVNPETEGITRSRLLNPEYAWMFSEDQVINGIFSRYRSVEPKIGGNIDGIVKIELCPLLKVRTGLKFQYVSFTRIVQDKLASYRSSQNYQLTLELHNVEYEASIKMLYLAIPMNIEYEIKKYKLAVFGGVQISRSIYDNIKGFEDHSRFISFDREGKISTIPLQNKYILSANLGVLFKLTDKIDGELYFERGLTNMFYKDKYYEILFRTKKRDSEIPNFNKQKSLMQQISIGISYRLF